MIDFLQKHDTADDKSPYDLHGIDLLGVLSSTQSVVEVGEHVWINEDCVAELAQQWLQQDSADTTVVPPPTAQPYDRYHFFDGTERTVNWVLALDAMNFCFWSEKDQPRWRIEYKGELLNGYLAEAAALTRAVEEDIPIWDAHFLSTISDEALAAIFRGEQTIPLFEQRLQNIRQVGRVLLERYDGQFTNAIEQADGSAVKLATLLAKHFPSFNDVALYRTHTVRFLKRAQICVADLHSLFNGQSWGAFPDIDQLTVFADYKLPQVLRQYGILEYHPSLAQRIDNQEIIEAGSEEEVELRAATVWACELLRRAMAHEGYPLTAAQIDLRLWSLGQHSTEMKPYHRTPSIFY